MSKVRARVHDIPLSPDAETLRAVMFAKVPHLENTYNDTFVGPNVTKPILTSMALFAGRALPAKTLCHLTGRSKATVGRAVTMMLRAGWIESHKVGSGAQYAYTINRELLDKWATTKPFTLYSPGRPKTPEERRAIGEKTRQRAIDSGEAQMITAFGFTGTSGDWSKRTGLYASTINKRLRAGWSHERAVSVKDGRRR